MPGDGCGCRSTKCCWPHWAGRSRTRSATGPSPSTSAGRAGRCSNPTSTCAARSAGSPPSIRSRSPAPRRRRSAKQLLDDVHNTLTAVPHYGIGYGLLRYLYAPTARQLGAAAPADIFFSYIGTIPDLPPLGEDVAVQFDTDTALPVREAIPGLGHAIELRVFRTAGVLHLDWWYDTRRVDGGHRAVACRRVLTDIVGADPGSARGKTKWTPAATKWNSLTCRRSRQG